MYHISKSVHAVIKVCVVSDICSERTGLTVCRLLSTSASQTGNVKRGEKNVNIFI